MKYKALIAALIFGIAVSALAQQPPETSRQYFETGLKLISEKKFTEALSAFRESARLEPKRAETYANIGLTLVVLQRPEEAIVSFREAVRLAPLDGRAHTELCSVLSATGQHAEAIKECEEGVRFENGSPEAHAALFSASKAGGRPLAEILRELDLAVGRFRDNEALLALATDFYFESGNFPYTAELLQRLTSLKPNAAIYHGFLAEVLLALERDTESLSEARKALHLEPDSPYANYAMGLIFFELGQHEEAEQAFGNVRSDLPRFKFAPYYKAVSQKERGRPEEAIATLRDLVSRFPDVFDFQEKFGSILSENGRYGEAIAPMLKARRLAPNDLRTLRGLGLAFFESGKLDEAITVLNDGLRIYPGDEVLTMFLNVTRGRQKLLPQIDELKEYANAHQDDAHVRVRLIQALAYSGRVNEADPWVKELYDGNLRDTLLYAHVAVAYGTAGQLDKATEVYRKSLEIKENPAALLGLSAIYKKKGNVEGASAAFTRYLELRPNSTDVMVMFANHLRNHGKRRPALEMFRRSLAIKPNDAAALFGAGVLSAKLGEREAALQYLQNLRNVDPGLAKKLGRCLQLRIWG